jgi:hypothetical protein
VRDTAFPTNYNCKSYLRRSLGDNHPALYIYLNVSPPNYIEADWFDMVVLLPVPISDDGRLLPQKHISIILPIELAQDATLSRQ